MAKRVFIIHGWEGYPEEGWFPWLKKELETRKFKVQVPTMPNTNKPKIDSWVNFLKKKVGVPDKETFFVGHSVGCQGILRYLETLDLNIKIKGAVFIAPWTHLDEKTIEEEGEEIKEIAKPWMETPINWDKIKSHTKKFICIFSDNDQYIPVDDSKIFEEKLRAKIIIEHNKGHFSGSDGIKKIPIVLDELLKMSDFS